MAFFDNKNTPLANWKQATSSLIASRRGKNEPTVLRVDDLLESYGKAESDEVRLGLLDTLFIVLHKWLADYSGSRAPTARALLAEVTAGQKALKARNIKAVWAPIPEPLYPEFLARNKTRGDKYYTLGMLKAGGLGKDVGNPFLESSRAHNEGAPEEWHGLTYMDSGQRQRFLIEVKDGLLYYAGGSERMDTSKSHVTGKAVSNKVYIFVMDGMGHIYSAAKQDVEHHSSFLSGNPAAAAGGIMVQAGKLTYLNASSGHYAPSKDEIDQFLAELRSRGVDVSKVEMDKMATRKQRQANAKVRNIRGARLYPTGPREERC